MNMPDPKLAMMVLVLAAPLQADPIAIVNVDAPVMCRAPMMEKPVSCAYMAALVARIKPEQEVVVPVATWKN